MTESKAAADQLGARPSWGERIVGIEGLRAVAALSVLAYHVATDVAPSLVTDGVTGTAIQQLRHGLTLFFVLSGFLLYRQFAAAIIGSRPSPPVGRFWGNRALRIYPAYIFIVLFVAFVMQAARPSSAPITGKESDAGSLGFIDTLWSLTMVQTLDPDHVRTGLGVAWSLTTELTFYLALPALAVLAAFVAARTSRRVVGALAPVALLLVVGFAGRIWLMMSTDGMTSVEKYDFEWGHTWTAVISRSILVHGDLFALGMAVAVAYVCVEQSILRFRLTPRLVSALAATIVVAAALTWLSPLEEFRDTTAGVAAACALALVIMPSKVGGRTRIASAFNTRLPVFLGLISYSVYLWHIPIMWWLQRHSLLGGDSLSGGVVSLAVVAVVTIAAASGTYFGIEKRAEQLKKRTDRRPAQPGTESRSVR